MDFFLRWGGTITSTSEPSNGSAVRDWLLSIFAATLHIWYRVYRISSIRGVRTRRVAVTFTHNIIQSLQRSCCKMERKLCVVWGAVSHCSLQVCRLARLRSLNAVNSFQHRTLLPVLRIASKVCQRCDDVSVISVLLRGPSLTPNYVFFVDHVKNQQ